MQSSGLTLTGPGANKLTISGNHNSRVFDITDGTVTIAGLTITDGWTTSDYISPQGVDYSKLGGGGILNTADATLNLTSCSVVNNKAYAGAGLDVFGGGLLNLGTANVTACTFTGNQVLNGSALSPPDFFGGSVGGAIDNFGTGTVGHGATLTVTNSTFINNQAIGAGGFYGIGGAIENNAGFKLDHPSSATIRNSTFTNNLATAGPGGYGNGGAIDNEGTGAFMTLTNSRLIDNQSIGGYGAHGLGGGILNAQGSTLIVTSSTFIGNQAIGGGSTSTPTFAFGGGINNTSAGLTVSDSSFFGNKALTRSPGGVAVGGGIENGFYYVSGEGLELELMNCTLSGNQAIGGGLDNSFGATATIKDSQIINNQALGGAGGPGDVGRAVGGGISVGSGVFFDFTGFSDAASLTITGSTIASNLARGGNGGSGANGGNGQGGGIWFGLDSTGTLDNSVITGNFALGGQAGAGGTDGQGVGGGVYINSGDVVDVKPTTKVKGNHASTSHDNIGP